MNAVLKREQMMQFVTVVVQALDKANWQAAQQAGVGGAQDEER